MKIKSLRHYLIFILIAQVFCKLNAPTMCQIKSADLPIPAKELHVAFMLWVLLWKLNKLDACSFLQMVNSLFDNVNRG